MTLRSSDEDQKDIAKKFFQINKSNKEIELSLKRIVEDKEEPDSLRLQALIILKREFKIQHHYLQYDRLNLKEEEIVECSTIADKVLALPQEQVKPVEQPEIISYLVDSLPYIDQVYIQDAKVKAEMSKLVSAEMERMSMAGKKAYLEAYPYPELKVIDTPAIREEFKRVGKLQKLNLLRTNIRTKFELPPPNKAQDLLCWDSLMKSVESSLQHFGIKNLNLDLLIKHGPASWKKFLGHFDNLIAQLDKEKLQLEKEIEAVNKERKYSQVIKFY